MKKQLPVGLFVIVFIVAVLFICNYQWDDVEIPLSQIFPEDSGEFPEIEYAYIKMDIGDKSGADATGIKKLKHAHLNKEVEDLPSGANISAGLSAARSVEPKYPDIVSSDFSQVPFTIQVASYKDERKAGAAFDKIKANGYSVYLVEKSLKEKGIWYRIYIGKFNTYDEAAERLLKIQRDFKDSFIIRPGI